ncbi:hypothetical protein Q7P37_009224 [Cladosporium fusiforme]
MSDISHLPYKTSGSEYTLLPKALELSPRTKHTSALHFIRLHHRPGHTLFVIHWAMDAESTGMDIIPSAESRICPFCSACFSRVDSAKRHAKRCIQRGSRELPDRKRGRRPKACDECSRVKVHCTVRREGSCERCVARKLECSLARNGASTATRRKHSEARDRVALAFLLSVTDDQQDFITERAIGSEPDCGLLGPTAVSTSFGNPCDEGLLEFMDPAILLLFDYNPYAQPVEVNGLYGLGSESYLGGQTPPLTDATLISARLDCLVNEVATHAKSAADHGTSFDGIDFRHFLSVTNVRTFVATFCHKRHYYYPIIHWASFSIEDASSVLLLVVALTGAAYTFGRSSEAEHAITARRFYTITDSYVFRQLETMNRGMPDRKDLDHTVQICQAALLMYALEILPSSDKTLRETGMTKRLPMLISSLRRLGFTRTRHEPEEDWQSFIHREQIIRIVAWTYCADCLATLAYNKPPSFSLLEMYGDLPCEATVWEAESPVSIERLEHSRKAMPRCLKDLMSWLLDVNHQTSLDEPRLPVFHLHILLCAFQQFIYNLQITITLTYQSSNVLQALRRWRYLWNNGINELSETDRMKLGVARVLSALELLTRKIVEVAVSDASSSSRYLQRVPAFDTKDLHTFIDTFVME